jgi:hypothetical protein
LRSWWLLPPGRARSESTCFRRISARTPPPIPPAAPLSPRRLARGGPTRQQRQKARLSTAPFAGGSSGLGGGDGASCSPPAAGRRPPSRGMILWRWLGGRVAQLLFLVSWMACRWCVCPLYGARKRIKAGLVEFQAYLSKRNSKLWLAWQATRTLGRME